MGKFILDYALSQLRSASVIRYIITMIVAPLAAKYGLDAIQTGNVTDWLVTGALAVATAGPGIIAQLGKPSAAGIEAGKQVDKVIAGDKPSAVVQTPAGVPNIKITVQPTRGNQG